MIWRDKWNYLLSQTCGTVHQYKLKEPNEIIFYLKPVVHQYKLKESCTFMTPNAPLQLREFAALTPNSFLFGDMNYKLSYNWFMNKTQSHDNKHKAIPLCSSFLMLSASSWRTPARSIPSVDKFALVKTKLCHILTGLYFLHYIIEYLLTLWFTVNLCPLPFLWHGPVFLTLIIVAVLVARHRLTLLSTQNHWGIC